MMKNVILKNQETEIQDIPLFVKTKENISVKTGNQKSGRFQNYTVDIATGLVDTQ